MAVWKKVSKGEGMAGLGLQSQIREAMRTEKGEGWRRVGEKSLGDNAGVETGVEEGDAGEWAVGRVFKGFGPENFGGKD